jgi:hypothetical protein
MMFRRLQKQLHDTELGTGSGTTGTRTCTYVQVQWGYTSKHLDDLARFLGSSVLPGTRRTYEGHVRTFLKSETTLSDPLLKGHTACRLAYLGKATSM